MPLIPAEQAEYDLLAQFVDADRERKACEGSLFEFFKRAWREIDPAPFEENWHHHAICEQLEALVRGEYRDAVVNIPPRTGKSNLITVCFPAWVWTLNRNGEFPLMGAHCSFLCVSYGAVLAEVAAVKMRRLVMGEWYQRLWGDKVTIRDDQASRSDFGNTAGGERISTSIEGGILGRGALIQIIDDPHKLDAVESDVERTRTLRAIKEGLTTRITDPRISARILVMQRLHTDDATEYALANWRPDLRHIILPMRFDPSRACFCDVRLELGELLWPEVWTEDAVHREETELGPYGAAGQLAQMPTPRGGGIIKLDWIEPWPPLSAAGIFPDDMIDARGRIIYPAFEYVVACVDTAFTEKQTADRSAMAVLGIFRAEGKGRIERRPDGGFTRVADDYGFPKALLIHGWAKRLELHGPNEEIPPGVTSQEWNSPQMQAVRREKWGLVEWVIDTCTRYKVDYLQILTLGQGHGLEQELFRLHQDNDWTVGMEVERGDKVARGYRAQPFFAAHQIYAPQYEDGTYPTWCDPLIRELVTFPMGRFKDFPDAIFGCIRHLREIGMLERREEFDRAETASMSWENNRRVTMPYDT